MNDCRGHFLDVSDASGAAVEGWSVAATFLDIDADGWLDLFITRYAKYSVAANRKCSSPVSPTPSYCGPLSYPPDTSVLLRNQRDGTFVNISRLSAFEASPSASLGVAALDANRDGRLDLFVANDMRPNMLWVTGDIVEYVTREIDWVKGSWFSASVGRTRRGLYCGGDSARWLSLCKQARRSAGPLVAASWTRFMSSVS